MATGLKTRYLVPTSRPDSLARRLSALERQRAPNAHSTPRRTRRWLVFEVIVIACSTAMHRGLALLRQGGLSRALPARIRCFSSQVDELISNVAEKSTQDSRHGSLLARYNALVQQGTLKPDAQQAACIVRLDRLCSELSSYKVSVDAYQKELAAHQVWTKTQGLHLHRRPACFRLGSSTGWQQCTHVFACLPGS
jgi:hypothetical protein